MDRVLPHPPYAEDQPYARTILWTHIMTRALPTGAAVGLGISGVRALLPSSGKPTPIPNVTSAAATAAKALRPRLLTTAGTGVAATAVLLVPATVARMWGREEIEWQDRSWRLLESRGQVEVDYWTYGGMAAGLVGQQLAGGAGGWRGRLGAGGLGSLAGVAGYMGWRYGAKKGKFD